MAVRGSPICRMVLCRSARLASSALGKGGVGEGGEKRKEGLTELDAPVELYTVCIHNDNYVCMTKYM